MRPPGARDSRRPQPPPDGTGSRRACAAVTGSKSNLRDTVAGLLLQSQLALAEPAISPHLANKLKLMVELAGNLRQKLDQGGTTA